MGRQPWIENAVVIAPRMKLSAPLTRRPATAVHPRATREAKLKIGTSQPREWLRPDSPLSGRRCTR